jgi:hypothetical protein
MRYCNDIAITKTVIHVIDSNADEPLLGNKLLELDEETYMYLHNHIYRALNNDSNRRGEFLIKTSLVHTKLNEMLSSDDFVEHTKVLASHLFKVVKNTLSAPSGDLIALECVVEGHKVLGLLFMEYNTSFTHDIKFEECEFHVDLKQYTVSLPNQSQRLTRFVFFGESTLLNRHERSYDMVMMERKQLDENGEEVSFFISDFLQATVVLDNCDVTRLFRKSTERWIRRNMKESIGHAIDIRSELDDQYVNNVEIDIQSTVESVIDSVEERDKFLMDLEKAGVDTDGAFEIDKKWTGKKLKVKTIKTDTGFSIKGDFDIFDDTSRLEIQYNGDGTVNYVIKQVRNIHQS